MERRWITVKEAAQYLGLHEKTIYRLTYKRAIPFAKVPGIGIRIDLKELDRMLLEAEKFPKNIQSILNQKK